MLTFQVSNTNDLTSLARAHSALHRAVTPLIYSRFDIVWPDEGVTSAPRVGVDALTYGLSTLVMAQEIFEEADWQLDEQENTDPFTSANPRQPRILTDDEIRQRRGNHYAHHIRKFSLGNGPRDWVKDYLITKEGGKMLGTLVALAVTRMKSLETFIWDMPTGVIRDVWAALAHLGRRRDGRPVRLEKVWIRYHDNASSRYSRSSTSDPAPPSIDSLKRVEYPSFSRLPPLKSLNVVAIDELQYLDEMSVLIGKSVDKLKELRVGIAETVWGERWVRPWTGNDAKQIDHDQPTRSTSTISEQRLGGVMGVLTSAFFDLRRDGTMQSPTKSLRRRTLDVSEARSPRHDLPPTLPLSTPVPDVATVNGLVPSVPIVAAADQSMPMVPGPVTASIPPPSVATGSASMPIVVATEPPATPSTPPRDDTPLPAQVATPDIPVLSIVPPQSSPGDNDTISAVTPAQARKGDHLALEYVNYFANDNDDTPKHKKLKLEVLELERVVLHLPTLAQAIDWTHLTTLTLLRCHVYQDELWKLLRRQYAVTDDTEKPRLQIKHLQTDHVTRSFLAFVHHTLPVDSLESVFLQSGTVTHVEIALIMRHIVRRHGKSIRRLLIDSMDRPLDQADNTRWTYWCLTREALDYILSPEMPKLRQLSCAVDYRRNWHYFLQRLPRCTQLRSMHITRVSDRIVPTRTTIRELAMSILDVIVLKPEIELCYLAITNKCFEIQEGTIPGIDGTLTSTNGISQAAHNSDMSDSELSEDYDDDDDMSDEDEDENDDDHSADEHEPPGPDTLEEPLSDDDLGSEFDEEEFVRKPDVNKTNLRLREILFYDDKIAIFKARHGRL